MGDYWANLSQRERTLMITTLSIAAFSLCVFVGYRALNRLDRLDQRIGQLEQELINLTDQEARSRSAEIAFRAIASEHSSAWTKEEIEDRLHTEIYRLALKNVNTLNAKKADYLVQIPTLHAATLRDDEEGYREFETVLQLEPDRPLDILKFIARLQQSRQSLRVDGLEMGRRFRDTKLTATILITRTVLNSNPDEVYEKPVNLTLNSGFESWHPKAGFRYWENSGCELNRTGVYATEGRWCVDATALEGPGEFYQVLELEPGATYRLKFDVTAETQVEVAVKNNDDVVEGSQQVQADGKPHRYELFFDATGDGPMAVPYITLPQGEGHVYIDNIEVMKVQS